MVARTSSSIERSYLGWAQTASTLQRVDSVSSWKGTAQCAERNNQKRGLRSSPQPKPDILERPSQEVEHPPSSPSPSPLPSLLLPPLLPSPPPPSSSSPPPGPLSLLLSSSSSPPLSSSPIAVCACLCRRRHRCSRRCRRRRCRCRRCR